MEINISPDPATASKEAARFLAAIIRKKPGAVLGLATGSTPVPLYRVQFPSERGMAESQLDELRAFLRGGGRLKDWACKSRNRNPARR